MKVGGFYYLCKASYETKLILIIIRLVCEDRAVFPYTYRNTYHNAYRGTIYNCKSDGISKNPIYLFIPFIPKSPRKSEKARKADFL